ncbi:MAG: hypothetical protein ACRDTH_05095 [Pseudonocardiaceae bacterium]
MCAYYAAKCPDQVARLEIEGAQHGFAVHDDPQYLHPQSQSGKPS